MLGVRFESHLETLPQHFHIALTAVTTVHTGVLCQVRGRKREGAFLYTLHMPGDRSRTLALCHLSAQICAAVPWDNPQSQHAGSRCSRGASPSSGRVVSVSISPFLDLISIDCRHFLQPTLRNVTCAATARHKGRRAQW